MVGDKLLIWAVAEAHGSILRVDQGLVPRFSQDVQERGQRSTVTGPRAQLATFDGTDGGASFAGDRGYRFRARGVAGSIECGRHQLCRQGVVARRERDGDLAIRPSVELSRTTGAWPGATTPASILGLEQAGPHQPVEMESGQLAADPDRHGGVVSADHLRAGGYQLIKAPTVRLLEERH